METKSEFRNRLKREGRWDEFVEYREKFKSEGYDAKIAYQKAKHKISSNTQENTVLGNDDTDMANIVHGGGCISRGDFDLSRNVSARKVVQWVFNNIDIGDVQPSDAPSPGAWSLLQRVRCYPDLLKEFYRTIWAKMLPTRSEIEQRERYEDDGRELLDFIDRIKRGSGKDE